MNDFLIYTLPIWAIIAIIVFTVLTVLCIISLLFGKFSENIIKFLQIVMVVSTVSCGLVCLAVLYFFHLDTQNHKYKITKTDNEVVITSQSQWIKNAHYPILEHKNGAYYLEQEPNKTIKISDERLSELINNQ